MLAELQVLLIVLRSEVRKPDEAREGREVDDSFNP